MRLPLIISSIKVTSMKQKKKEKEKRHTSLDLARKLKKIWNLKETVISIVIGALGTIPKGQVNGVEDLEIRGQVETIQTAA